MIEAMNSDCFCVSLDRDALRQAIEADPSVQGLSALVEARTCGRPAAVLRRS